MPRWRWVTAVRPAVAACLLTAGCGACFAAGALKESAPKLTPGSTFTIAFSEMPPTLAEALDNARVKAQMTVFLPTNYDPGRKHPLLIFLNGGNGGTGGNPGVARGLAEEKDFVCVGLPLFKEKVAPATPASGVERILVRDADARFAWPLYKAMLAKLEEAVPNSAPGQRILGGFSNGAHMTAGLINESDGEVAKRFSAFFLVDGGGGLKRFDLLKGKPLLMVCGRWRPKQEAALAAGVKLVVYRMKNAAHAFPESEYPAVREWLRGPDTAKLVRAAAASDGRQDACPTLKVGDQAPDFKLTATDGTEYSLGQFAGKSAVALCWYLRADSGGSRTELSAIQAEMGELSKYRVQVLGVTLSKLEANKAFAEKMKLGFPLLSDPSLAAARAYGTVRSMDGAVGPLAERWVFLIDAQGIIRSIDRDEDVDNKGKLLLSAIEAAKLPKK